MSILLLLVGRKRAGRGGDKICLCNSHIWVQLQNVRLCMQQHRTIGWWAGVGEDVTAWIGGQGRWNGPVVESAGCEVGIHAYGEGSAFRMAEDGAVGCEESG